MKFYPSTCRILSSCLRHLTTVVEEGRDRGSSSPSMCARTVMACTQAWAMMETMVGLLPWSNQAVVAKHGPNRSQDALSAQAHFARVDCASTQTPGPLAQLEVYLAVCARGQLRGFSMTNATRKTSRGPASSVRPSRCPSDHPAARQTIPLPVRPSRCPRWPSCGPRCAMAAAAR